LRIYNKFIVSLAVAFGLVNILLAFLGQDDLAIYFIVNAIVYLIVALSYTNLNLRAQTSVNRLGALVFFGFFMTLVFKIVEILK